MFASLIASFTLFTLTSFNPFPTPPSQHERILAHHEIALTKRYNNAFVNDVFKDNILLNIAYMDNQITPDRPIDWDAIEKPIHSEIKLHPQETFAFHDAILPQYKGKVVKTTNAHFNAQEGFKSDGYLIGDGVCHLASLMNWVAKDANLHVLAPTHHDFAPIPEIPSAYGVAIYHQNNEETVSEEQNLYITNNLQQTISFKFDYENEVLKVSAVATD